MGDAERAAVFQDAPRIAANVSLFGPGGIGRLSADQVRDRIVRALLVELKKWQKEKK